MSTDAFGTPYAKISSLKAGDKIRVDDGFTCMKRWSIKEVKEDENGQLYIDCTEGFHYLDNLDDPRDFLIGIYPL